MSNQQESQHNQLLTWEQQNKYLVDRGISEEVWSVLCNTLYPSSKPESVMLAWDYCEARELDIMMKPIHLVPMQVKNAQTGSKEWRDVPMPGVGLYRIQASRSGNYAGADEPEFGDVIEATFTSAYNANEKITVRYPEWCKYTVHKMIGDRIVAFSAKEYWLENYATMKAASDCPNAMWKKRPHGQLAKCAEAQALRKAWPEIGQEPTAEEMEGKDYFLCEKDVTPTKDDLLAEIYDRGFKAITAGNQTPEQVLGFIAKKGLTLSPEQTETLKNIEVAAL